MARADPRSDAAVGGLCLVRQGKLDEAQRRLQGLLALDSENAEAHTNLAVVFLRLGRVDQARAEFREALRINPQQQEARDALREIGDQ